MGTPPGRRFILAPAQPSCGSNEGGWVCTIIHSALGLAETCSPAQKRYGPGQASLAGGWSFQAVS